MGVFVSGMEKMMTASAVMHKPIRWGQAGGYLAGAVWLAACTAGIYWAMSYDFRPGQLGSARLQWPSETLLKPAPGKLTVVAFIHPRCVCSKATVNQLIKAVARHPEVSVIVPVFAPPKPDTEDWEQAEYVKLLKTGLPDARVIMDQGGLEAARFQAPTSGVILVYDKQAREIFRGGITNRRGGEEDNPGLRAFNRTLTTGRHDAFSAYARVFGCSLVAPAKTGGG